MMFVVVALIDETRIAIAASLEALGMEVRLLASLGELQATLQEIPVSGILLDLITSTKSSTLDKQSTHDLIQLYPNARFKIVGNDVLILGKEQSLERFVSDCRHFRPRTIRKSPRKIRHIAFFLSADDTFVDAEKVVTLNISDGGCFVYSTREWNIGDRVCLRFIDNDVVILGTVRWWQPWGNNKMIPGIGVRLDAEGNGL
jgi:Tfp pilus assembly protein PilZ